MATLPFTNCFPPPAKQRSGQQEHQAVARRRRDYRLPSRVIVILLLPFKMTELRTSQRAVASGELHRTSKPVLRQVLSRCFNTVPRAYHALAPGFARYHKRTRGFTVPGPSTQVSGDTRSRKDVCTRKVSPPPLSPRVTGTSVVDFKIAL